MEKRSRNLKQVEKSQINCMWGLIFGQNHRKQKLLSNGKTAAKHIIGKSPRKLDALTYFHDHICGSEDGAGMEILGDYTGKKKIKNFILEEISSDMQKNTQIIARNETHKVDYGLFDHMISKYKPSSKETCKNPYIETQVFQQASGSAEMSIDKLNLASILEAICSQIHQDNGDSQRDEISLQVLQTSAKAFIDQLFIDRMHISRSNASYEPEQFSDALDLLNSKGDLFLKLFQDPNSILAKQIRSLQNVQIARESIKSMMRNTLSDGQKNQSSSSQPSNKIVILKPIPGTVRCSEYIDCHCSAMQSHCCTSSSKEENFKRKNFSLKDIKRKLKYALGEKLKEKHLISAGSTTSHKLHRVGNQRESISSEVPKVALLTESVHKKLDVSAFSYTKKQELNISMEAKRHLSQRLSYISSTMSEAQTSRQPSRTLARILSSPEHDLLFKNSSNQDSNCNPAAQMRYSPFRSYQVAVAKGDQRHNDTNLMELPPEPALTSVQSPRRDKDRWHLNSSMVASPSEVWSPGSSTDVSSSSPSSIYKLRVVDNNMDREDHPSPVSVLEPVFADDLASPSDDTSLRPRRIDFEGCSNGESPESLILNSAESDVLHMCILSCLQILRLNCEELWLNKPHSEQMLDAMLSDELETLALQCHSEPNLHMNYTNEVLLEAYDAHFRFPPWLSLFQLKLSPFPHEKNLVEKLIEEVRQNLVPVMIQPTLNEHVQKDMAKCDFWLDTRNDTEDILIQVTDGVLEESILDIVVQLHTSFICS